MGSREEGCSRDLSFLGSANCAFLPISTETQKYLGGWGSVSSCDHSYNHLLYTCWRHGFVTECKELSQLLEKGVGFEIEGNGV